MHRIQQIAEVAVKNNRRITFVGRSMVRNMALAQELGYMHLPEGVEVDLDADLALLEVDERFLNGLGFRWETVIDGASRGQARRWLLIHDYPPPQGFTTERTLLALEIPPTYPNAQIDMFYTNPPLALATGRPIDRTQVSARIAGVDFNGWSRHRGPQSQWDPASDNVMTHLALVESAMAKEVSE